MTEQTVLPGQDFPFKKVKKLYNVDYYFRGGVPDECPSNPHDALTYFTEYKEWPFGVPPGATLVDQYYEVCIAHQKRQGVYADQYFTSPKNADFVATWIEEHSGRGQDSFVLDPCCGFGMLTSRLRRTWKDIHAFERDLNLLSDAVTLVGDDYTHLKLYRSSFEDYENPEGCRYDMVIGNPPFSINRIEPFFRALDRWLAPDGDAYLILPVGIMNGKKSKGMAEALGKFAVVHEVPLPDSFALTNYKCNLVHLYRD